MSAAPALGPDEWVTNDAGVILPGAVADAAPCCGEQLPVLLPSGVTAWSCTREAAHAGRHLASAGRHGRSRVVAAWPGRSEPSTADLTAVPS